MNRSRGVVVFDYGKSIAATRLSRPFVHKMAFKRKLTIRTILYWTFLVALLLPYVVALVPWQYNPLIAFSVGDSEIESWLREVDHSAEILCGGGGGGSNDSYSSRRNCLVTFNSSNSDELMSHLRTRVEKKFEQQLWDVRGAGTGGSSFHYHLQRLNSHCHLYLLDAPPAKEREGFLEATGQKGFQLTIITICYNR